MTEPKAQPPIPPYLQETYEYWKAAPSEIGVSCEAGVRLIEHIAVLHAYIATLEASLAKVRETVVRQNDSTRLLAAKINRLKRLEVEDGK